MRPRDSGRLFIELRSGAQFIWCSGCGGWHDHDRPDVLPHHDMALSPMPPGPDNFDGTAAQLAEAVILWNDAVGFLAMARRA